MKISIQRMSRKSGQRGVALILVLGALVLISAIVIGFLSTVRQDRTSAAYYESGSSARQYADTAVTIAIAQIAEATSDPDLAWISQPGLLRTFNASGTVAAYKLYSSDTMKITGTYNPETALNTEIPTSWSTRTDEFVDLNAPVKVTMNGTEQSIYPIVNPAAVSDVEGFTLDSSIPTGNGTSANSLPMPVRWIYVRKNGQLVDYTTAQTVDDITARIAFWGDDETCKVNINTASDGVYYDAPVADIPEDYALAQKQPIAQEYQRYPGHPATTSLASVFTTLRKTSNAPTRSSMASQITPRVGWGGSQGGTIMAWLYRNVGVLDYDRLFPSVDELAFGRGSSGNWVMGNGTADLRNPSTLITDVTRLPFFLTTDSRAPELNAFNRPRVTLWPFNTELVADPTKLTPEDRLIKAASEIGSNQRKLYFQRQDARDPTNDYANITENQQLYAYLQWLTKKPFPGDATRTGGSTKSLETKFTALGRDQILTEMFDFLRCQVNTRNYSYEPVGGPVYSFPQNNNGATNKWFGDLCPIQIPSGAATTQGFGVGGITLKEFIMQFYNAGEKTVDLLNINTSNSTCLTGGNGTDGYVDSIIRKVQMVIYLDYTMSVNNLNGAAPTFQVTMKVGDGSTTSSGFYINPNPSGVPTSDLDKVWVRKYVTGQADNVGWQTGPIELQLPPTSTNVYCNPDSIQNSNPVGGSLSIMSGLWAKGATLSTGVPDPNTNNGTTVFGETGNVGAKKNLDSTKTQDYRYYPFVSAMLEFRIPLLLDGNATHTSYSGNNTTYGHATTSNATYYGNGTIIPGGDATYSATANMTYLSDNTTHTTDHTLVLNRYFKDTDNQMISVKSSLTVNSPGTTTANISIPVRLEAAGGSTFTPVVITMYPGLKNNATLLTDLEPLTNYIQQVSLNVDNSNLPLPRLGPDIPYVAIWNQTIAPQYLDASGHQYSPPHYYSYCSEMIDYSKRLEYYAKSTPPGDMMMLVPNSNVPTGNATTCDTKTLMDTFRSYTLNATTGAMGDFRLAAVKRDIPSTWFEKNPSYNMPGTYFGMSYVPQFFTRHNNPEIFRLSTNIFANGTWDLPQPISRPVANLIYGNSTQSYVEGGRFAAYGTNGAFKSNSTEGDFTNGYAFNGDGGKVRGVDIGATAWYGYLPYYNSRLNRTGSNDTDSLSGNTTHNGFNYTGLVYSPWKQMPSAVMFGTLPSRATEVPPGPWETLLFNPVPLGGRANHRGWTELPRDHFWLDLFYMPVVEPYAITDNFATNGKINLNQQIAPFTYIRRNTGLWALMRNMKVLALSSTDAVAKDYKNPTANAPNIASIPAPVCPSTVTQPASRIPIDVSTTVAQIQDRLKVSNDPFVTASEICEIPMIFDSNTPATKTPATIEAYWATLKLSGDDSREAPYNAIYPRVTTRSNSFKIHFIAQSLKGKGGKWSIVGQYRGSQVIERYLDGFSGGATAKRVYGTGSTADTQFPALAGNDATGIPYYRFRKLSHQQFAP